MLHLLYGTNKVCCRCHQRLPVELFSPRPGRLAHLLTGWCCPCQRQQAKEYRRKHASRIATNTRTYAAEHPERVVAIKRVSAAIKAGTLIRQACSFCDRTANIQAHHPNYDKPLDVVWLCPRHHKQLHLSPDSPPPSRT